MKAEWYYVRNEERVGPRAFEELVALSAGGIITRRTMMWAAGMQNWKTAGEIPDLQLLFGTVREPPPIPKAPNAAEQTIAVMQESIREVEATPPANSLAKPKALKVFSRHTSATETHPWRRWLAKVIDVGILGFVLGFGMQIIAPDTMREANTATLNIVITMLLEPVEALLITRFGTTIGKSLLRITVLQRNGDRLPFQSSLKRAASVWMNGLGLGIPIVSFVTQVVGYSNLNDNDESSWDVSAGSTVAHGMVSTARRAAIALVVISLITLAFIGESMKS